MYQSNDYTHSDIELRDMRNLLIENYSHNTAPINWFFNRLENWQYAHNFNVHENELKELSNKVRLWRDDTGNLAGFCISEYGDEEYNIQISPQSRGVEQDILQWIIDKGPGRRTVYALEEDDFRINLLKLMGFECIGHYANIYEYDLITVKHIPILEEGFTFSNLSELEDLETFFQAKDAAFPHAGSSKARFKTKSKAPGYFFEWNTLIMSNDNRCASFCTAWPDFICKMADIDPVGTHPEFQKKGLAKALLHETFIKLQAAGIQMAYIGTKAEPYPANYLYKSLNPSKKYKVLSFALDIK